MGERDVCAAWFQLSEGLQARQGIGVFISYYILMREGAWSHRVGQVDLAEVRDGWEAWELLRVALQRWWASLETQMVKESAYNARDPGSIPGSGRCLGEGSWHPFPASGSFLMSHLFASDGRSIYSQQKEDRELTVAQTMNSLLPNSDLN